MLYKRLKAAGRFMKGLSVMMAAFMMSPCFLAAAAASEEVPEKVFSGIGNASTIIANIDYQDVKASGTWAKEAIYETGALDLMKGYGDRQFGLKSPISKEQAIAMAYRAVGREADAQKAAEALDNARQKADKKTNPLSMWSDGYLQLAANEGLITSQDLADAFAVDQTTLTAASFHRGAPAQRQELAYWLAKAMKLQPVYSQQKIFNSYSDWQNTDPVKIPYIEPILQNGVMNGDGNGHFGPTQTVTREQAAQIIKNAEALILPQMNYEKNLGTIEGILKSKDLSSGADVTTTTFNIRNTNGKLHQIRVTAPGNGTDSGLNERSGESLPAGERDVVVYKDGAIGKSGLLEEGDRIEYITAPDNTVKYVKVISNSRDTQYMAVQVTGVDTANGLISASQVFGLDFPDMEGAMGGSTFDISGEGINTSYRYINGATVEIDGKSSDMGSLIPGTYAILTLRDGLVYAVKTVDLNMNNREKGIVKGIVEDCNPKLGYITLYNEDGTGTGADAEQKLILNRTYSFSNPEDVEVYKNHKSGSLEDIEIGDTAFLKTDNGGNVVSISAVDNYTVKYGQVISKNPASFTVEYDDGTQQVLDVKSGVPVVDGGKLSSYGGLKPGDRVRLLLNITNKSTDVKEIVLEASGNLVANIYKGSISYIDDVSGDIVAQNLQVFKNGRWVRTDRKGVSRIKLGDDYAVYWNNKATDLSYVNRYAKNNDAYIAVQRDYGDRERAVVVSFINSGDTEVLYSDSIKNVVSGKGEFDLTNAYSSVKYGPGSIIVKDGRLVRGNSLTARDTVRIAANRSYDSGDYFAGVIQVEGTAGTNAVQVYRGRISGIDDGKSFTVGSFSQLKDLKWEYTNTPMTFNLGSGTRILDDVGVVGQRNFVAYGDNSYLDKTVYVLAKDSNALLVSTAPFGSINVRGEIYDITGATLGEEGSVIQEPTGIKLKNVKTYDLSSYLWKDGKEMTLNLLKNTLILKGDSAIKASKLQKGDTVRILKKDSTQTGDAYIILVEAP
ncbi:MAG: S-layer homology domain-containing protein [Clostridiales bacterium]|jgi:hypothetical protein|nr:S-layer homology domain-containing protein [Eubacteriales bacterium]MDH7566460.1 S-layer homology domain-containing protein [Clostridiales bacterium]